MAWISAPGRHHGWFASSTRLRGCALRPTLRRGWWGPAVDALPGGYAARKARTSTCTPAAAASSAMRCACSVVDESR